MCVKEIDVFVVVVGEFGLYVVGLKYVGGYFEYVVFIVDD